MLHMAQRRESNSVLRVMERKTKKAREERKYLRSVTVLGKRGRDS